MKNKPLSIIFVALISILLAVGDIYFNYKDLTSQPLCTRELCNNHDPVNEGCDRDGKTLSQKIVDDMKIEFRYSIACDAGWVRAEAPPRSTLYLQDNYGNEYGRYSVTYDTKAGDHFGDMGAGRQLKACMMLPDKNNPICTEIIN
jgi:Protein of unknown function (DUF2690)